MRIPDSLASLFDHGILDEVVRPLMSGKEAQVFLVVAGGKHCVAKVYKDAQNRSFKQRAEYTEGRKVRNSRDQRAIGKRSKHGRAQDEAAWKSTEVDMIHRLHAAGVRVPVPLAFIDGVLVMELVVDADGNPAPRLADVMFDPDSARAMYERLMGEVVRMLAAGVVHGDLSDFNILIGADGPVIIDFPQSVDTAHNTNARKLLLRDVDNMHRFLAQFVPQARRLPYAEEMWELFQQNALTAETRLQGRYRSSERRANTNAVLEVIRDANYDERKRREGLGQRGGPTEIRSEPARHQPAPRNHDAPRHQPAPRNHDAPRHQPAPRNHDASRHPQAPRNHDAPRHPPAPRNHDAPRQQPAPQHGRPSQHEPSRPAQQGRPPQQHAHGRPAQHGRPPQHSNVANAPASPRPSGRGQRDEKRQVEVIVLRRPPTPTQSSD